MPNRPGATLYLLRCWCQPLLLGALLLLLGALLLAGCAGDLEARRRAAETSHQLGLAFLTENRPTLALRELTKAVQHDPSRPEVYMALGEAYWRKQELAQAEAAFRQAVELDPDLSAGWNNLGALYIYQGRNEAAVPVLERAVDNVFYETPERALVNLGWALHRLGRSAEAEQRLREAIEIAGNFPLAHKNLALVLGQRGAYEEGLRHIDEAIGYLPEDAESHLQRGMMLWKLGRRDEARSALERARRLAPGSEVGRTAKNYLDLMQ